MDEIEKEFHDRAVIHGQIYLFSSVDALDVIERCCQLGREIYGIDAFILWGGGKIQPVMEHSIDYSSIYYDKYDTSAYYKKYHVKKNSDAGHWEEAKQFIKDRVNKNYYFEVVYGDK